MVRADSLVVIPSLTASRATDIDWAEYRLYGPRGPLHNIVSPLH
jgi:hypothetical protein